MKNEVNEGIGLCFFANELRELARIGFGKWRSGLCFFGPTDYMDLHRWIWELFV
ncbi:hypothetical protein VDG1235_3540 [Verrucomicrobiia bacterium DG1235]|nr:hypothetical protein VDG1235_3540 [Verrucomicrobiae bacterium DG1235]